MQANFDADDAVTFFMPVIDKGSDLADYAIRSYKKIRNIPFNLLIYSNWCSESTKREYFAKWLKYDFVTIHENEWQTEDKRPSPTFCEAHGVVLDRELRSINTSYIATVDQDFEIIDARFVQEMLSMLKNEPNLVAVSVDHSDRQLFRFYTPFSQRWAETYTNERWSPVFCIYKRAAMQCNTSHQYYEKKEAGESVSESWDTSALFQKDLIEKWNFRIARLDSRFDNYYIHYGGSGWQEKRHDVISISLLRYIRILSLKGLLGRIVAFPLHRVYYLYKHIYFNKGSRTS